MDNKKIKILFGCLFFKSLTGSEMYVYELAKNLVKIGEDVSVISPNTDGILTEMANKNGIKVYNTNQPPINEHFDIIHCQHKPVTEFLCQVYPNVPKICTIHSEIIPLENPFKHDSIKKYIAIRPEIETFIVNNFNINRNDVEIIYNPIDENRFNRNNTSDQNYVLFVGTLDYLRRNTIFDLVEYTRKLKKDLWIVGTNHSDYLPQLLFNTHVKHFNSTTNVEDYFKNCSETAGILLGRTTIEGWMCGKKGWIYNIDDSGSILNKKQYNPPIDINKFYSSNVTKKIREEYTKILK